MRLICVHIYGQAPSVVTIKSEYSVIPPRGLANNAGVYEAVVSLYKHII